MTEIKVADEGGDVMTMLDFGNFRSSLFGRDVEYIRELNSRLKDFEFRDGDILLCSYPKAGTTWTFEILTMLMAGCAEGCRRSKMDTMLEAISADELNECSSPRLLNTHMPYRRIPPDISNKKVKIVFVVRNPKDAAVSFYNMMAAFKHYNYSGKFENWLPLYYRGDCIKQLTDFLDISLSEEVLQNISDKCQFDKMKSRYTPEMLGASSYKDGTPYGFMRKGEVGNWKEWFTVAQSEMVNKMVEQQMKGSKFKFIYEL